MQGARRNPFSGTGGARNAGCTAHDRRGRTMKRETQGHLVRGQLAIEAGSPEEAHEAALAAIAVEPTCARAHWLRGWAADDLANYEEAVLAFERAARLAPEDV